MAKKKEDAQLEAMKPENGTQDNAVVTGTENGTRDNAVATEPVKPENGVEIVVRSTFMDKYDHKKQYKPGDVLRFEEARALDVVKRGLADFVKNDSSKNKNPNEDGQATTTEQE
jgi:hypothetical protein